MLDQDKIEIYSVMVCSFLGSVVPVLSFSSTFHGLIIYSFVQCSQSCVFILVIIPSFPQIPPALVFSSTATPVT